MEDLSLIVLLDYDGTLTPIASDPAAAVLSDSVRSILQDLAEVIGLIDTSTKYDLPHSPYFVPPIAFCHRSYIRPKSWKD